MRRWWPSLLFMASRAFSAPADYLTARELERVRGWLPIYRVAAETVGVPVMALPAIHYRESDLRETWKVQPEAIVIGLHRRKVPYRNLGGPFMLDMGRDGDRRRFDENIRAFEVEVARWYGLDPVPRVRDDFPFACLCAAVELQQKARGRLVDRRGRVDRDILADALWGYNGRAKWQRTWRQSACVCNDPKRGRVLMQVSDSHSATKFLDGRPGSLVVYDELNRRL